MTAWLRVLLKAICKHNPCIFDRSFFQQLPMLVHHYYCIICYISPEKAILNVPARLMVNLKALLDPNPCLMLRTHSGKFPRLYIIISL